MIDYNFIWKKIFLRIQKLTNKDKRGALIFIHQCLLYPSTDSVYKNVLFNSIKCMFDAFLKEQNCYCYFYNSFDINFARRYIGCTNFTDYFLKSRPKEYLLNAFDWRYGKKCSFSDWSTLNAKWKTIVDLGIRHLDELNSEENLL